MYQHNFKNNRALFEKNDAGLMGSPCGNDGKYLIYYIWERVIGSDLLLHLVFEPA